MSAILNEATQAQNSQSYTCNHCKKSYATTKGLSDHISRYHREDEIELRAATAKFVCGGCGKPFARRDNLNRHMRKCTKVDYSSVPAPATGDKRSNKERECSKALTFDIGEIQEEENEKEEEKTLVFLDQVPTFPSPKRRKIEINDLAAPATGSALINVSDLLELLPVPHNILIDQSSQPVVETAEELNPRVVPTVGIVGHTQPGQGNIITRTHQLVVQTTTFHVRKYVPHGKVDTYAELSKYRGYHMCPTEGRVWRQWQEKPYFVCSQSKFHGQHLMLPQHCYRKLGRFDPPVPLKPSQLLNKHIELHRCSCGRSCTGLEQKEETDQRNSYKRSSIRQVFGNSAEVYRLSKKKELLVETAQYKRTAHSDDEEKYVMTRKEVLADVDAFIERCERKEMGVLIKPVELLFGRIFDRPEYAHLEKEEDDVCHEHRSPQLDDYELKVVQDSLFCAKIARQELNETAAMLRKSSTIVADSLLYIINNARDRIMDTRFKLFNAIFRRYLDHTETSVKFNLAPYLQNCEKGLFTKKDLSCTVSGAYESNDNWNKKSLNERFNYFTDLLHYSTQFTIEIKRCISQLNEWTKATALEERKPKELCMKSMVYWLKLQISTQDKLIEQRKQLLKEFYEQLCIITSTASTVTIYTRQELEFESRIPETVASTVRLRRMRQLMLQPHIASTLNIPSDYILDQLLQVVFLVRNGEGAELIVESQYPAIVGLIYERQESPNGKLDNETEESSDIECQDNQSRQQLSSIVRDASRRLNMYI